MANEWSEDLDQSFTASVFEGRHSGKGRGYALNSTANEQPIGWNNKKNMESVSETVDTGNDWDDESKDYGNSKNDEFADDTNDYQDEHGRDNNRDNFRGGSGFRRGGGDRGGGFRGPRRDNFDNDNRGNRRGGFGGGNRGNREDGFENEDGGYKRSGYGGGSRGNREDRSENENGGYSRRGGFGGGSRGNRGDGSENEDGGYSKRGGFGGGGRGNRGGSREDRESGKDDKEDGEKRPLYVPPEILMDEASLFGNDVTAGINFDKYDNIKVNVSGENVPPAIETFPDAGLRQLVADNIVKSGYKKPTPVQKHAIPIVMAGRDLMACAQTGSGKTAAFVVPIVNTLLEHPTELVVDSGHCEPQAIIVSPTRELAIQIHQQVAKFALGSILKHVVVYGGTSVVHQAKKIFHGCHILIATPGRLLDFVDKGRITFSSVRFLVLDEADRMLDMGFLPDMEKMVNHETMVPCGERQTLMFSATFPEEVQQLAKKFLDNYIFLAVGIVGGACSDVEQAFFEVSRFKKREKLKEMLEQTNGGKIEQTLVFVEKKRIADFLAAFLSESDFPTTSIHGDRYQQEREEALADFRSGKYPILVATDVAARGLDIKNVAHVVNYDMPKCITDYVHRIGRTGRVGNRGRATSFFDPDEDIGLTADLVQILRQANQKIPPWLECGGGNRIFGPGKSSKFGGEDIRSFAESAPNEPVEDW